MFLLFETKPSMCVKPSGTTTQTGTTGHSLKQLEETGTRKKKKKKKTSRAQSIRLRLRRRLRHAPGLRAPQGFQAPPRPKGVEGLRLSALFKAPFFKDKGRQEKIQIRPFLGVPPLRLASCPQKGPPQLCEWACHANRSPQQPSCGRLTAQRPKTSQNLVAIHSWRQVASSRAAR